MTDYRLEPMFRDGEPYRPPRTAAVFDCASCGRNAYVVVVDAFIEAVSAEELDRTCRELIAYHRANCERWRSA